MKIIGLSAQEQSDIFHVVGGVLHLGNVMFHESGNYASISDPQSKLTKTMKSPYYGADAIIWGKVLTECFLICSGHVSCLHFANRSRPPGHKIN